MSDKKHIDRLFQEKFKDFEAKPSANVWKNIQSQLEQPVAKPKVIPLWLKLAGVAATIALLFGIGSTFFDGNTIDNKPNTVVDTNANDPSNSEEGVIASEKDAEDNKLSNSNNDIINQNNLVNSEASNNTTNNKITNEALNNNTVTVSQHSNNGLENASNKTVVNTNHSISNKNNVVTPHVNYNDAQYANNGTQQSNENKEGATNNATQQRVAIGSQVQNKNKQPLYAQNKSNTDNNNSGVNNAIKNETKDTVDNTNVTDVANETEDQNNSVSKSKDLINAINANASNEGIAQTNNEEEKTNMNPKDEDAQTPNPLEEASLANTEDSIEKEKEETVMNRWTVNANVAPVYYNTLGKGSHIHDQFIDNPKNGEINTSYGINVGYALNERLKVRSGINKLNLSYDTADVIIYENVSNTPSSAPLRNIKFIPTNNGQNISVLSASNLSVQQVGGVLNDNLNAALSQRLSYIEVPVELEYALVNKRFGLHLIGGVSTLVLDGNEVVTEVENRKTKIGEANNINNVSFTTNLGLGIDYKFSDHFKLNVEPTFKYQINAYNETSGDFKPYIIGVYTGFSYKF